MVCCSCSGKSEEGGEQWFAQPRLFFSMKLGDEGTWDTFAHVRWLEAAGHQLEAPDMHCVRWAEGSDEYDVIPIGTIKRPVCLQAYPLDLDLLPEEEPAEEDFLVYNHFL